MLLLANAHTRRPVGVCVRVIPPEHGTKSAVAAMENFFKVTEDIYRQQEGLRQRLMRVSERESLGRDEYAALTTTVVQKTCDGFVQVSVARGGRGSAVGGPQCQSRATLPCVCCITFLVPCDRCACRAPTRAVC